MLAFLVVILLAMVGCAGVVGIHAFRYNTDPAYVKQYEADQAEREKRRQQEAQATAEEKRRKDEAAKIEAEKFSAIATAREFVKQRLKAPSTAKFAPGRESAVAILPDGNYAVQSWVDSQNSFGAMIRTKYIAVLKPMGDKWQLVKIATE